MTTVRGLSAKFNTTWDTFFTYARELVLSQINKHSYHGLCVVHFLV